MLEQALEGAKRVVDECDTQRYLYSLLVRLEAVSPFDMHYETKCRYEGMSNSLEHPRCQHIRIH